MVDLGYECLKEVTNMERKTMLICMLTLGILFISAVVTTTAAQDQPQYGGTLVYALSTPLSTLDPGITTGTQGQTVRKAIWDTLVDRDIDGKIIPCLAASWGVSADDLTWIFYLRRDVRFHDGSGLTAEDVKASLGRIINPDYALPRKSTLAAIESVEVVDKYTVTVTTSFPFAPLLSHLAMDVGSIMSKQALDTYGYTTEDIGWQPVGTGPYMYESHIPEESITLVRFDDHWAGKPYLDKIVFQTVREDATRVAMLEAGDADIIVNVPSHEVARLDADPSLHVMILAGNRVAHLGLNCQKPPFDDARVRQAMNYAVDREGLIVGILRGLGTPADSIVAPGVWGYSGVDRYSYDPDKARELLAEAGYPNGLDIALWTPQGRYFMDKEAVVAIQAQLKDVGINATVRVIDWTTYLSLIREPLDKTEIQAYFLGWEVGTMDIAYLLDLVFSSTNWPPVNWNTMFYKNETVDDLIVEGKSATAPEKRREIYSELQELVMEDAPWVPLFIYSQLLATRVNVHGFWAWPNETRIVRGVWKEK